jgi:hypothetical protein
MGKSQDIEQSAIAAPIQSHVYSGIAAVMLAMSREGISKSRRNEQQGFRFRGIDDVQNALSRPLADNHLCILPRVISRTVNERTNAKGTALFYVVLDIEYDIVSALDGSTHTVRVVGEAMDSGDKATNKAMSAAYKYMALQVFCIPTEGDNDADATTHGDITAEFPAEVAKIAACKSRADLNQLFRSLPESTRKALMAQFTAAAETMEAA